MGKCRRQNPQRYKQYNIAFDVLYKLYYYLETIDTLKYNTCYKFLSFKL